MPSVDIIQELLTDDYDADYVRPDAAACERARRILTAVPAPQGHASTPGDGMIVVEWDGGDRWVHARLCPDPARDCIVYGESGEFAQKRGLSAAVLAGRLLWMGE